MIVAVVGASGVLGRALVPQLQSAGATVRALVRSPEKARATLPAATTVERFDLLDPADAPRLPALLRGADAVVHAATAIPSDFTAPGAWDRNTRLRVDGTRTLTQCAMEARVGIYVQQSIALAYADGGDAWLDEDAPLDERQGGPITEPVRKMEATVRALPASVRWAILRGGNFTGPGTFQDGLVERIRAGAEPVTGDGRAFLPLVHADDYAAAVVAAIERGPAGLVANVADDPIRQAEYLDEIAWRVAAPPPPRRPDLPAPRSQRVSSARAREALGWAPVRGVWPAR